MQPGRPRPRHSTVVGWAALGVGATLLGGADLVARLVAPPGGGRDTFGLRLAGVRDLALGVALLRTRNRNTASRQALEQAVAMVQVGDTATALWMWSRGRLNRVTLVLVAGGAAATAVALAATHRHRPASYASPRAR